MAIEGEIIRLVLDKHFGFIRRDGIEYFFHRSALDPYTVFETLREGLRVEFLEEPNSPKGPRARAVKVIV